MTVAGESGTALMTEAGIIVVDATYWVLICPMFCPALMVMIEVTYTIDV